MHPIKPIIFIILIGLTVWWFFWPLVECSYALSWNPMFDPIHKFYLFIIGGVVLVVAITSCRKFLI